MTAVNISRSWACGKWRYDVVADGHAADTATCNYITGILDALAGYLNTLAERGELALFVIDRRSGSYQLRAQAATTDAGQQLLGAVESALIGLLQLERDRPDALKMINDMGTQSDKSDDTIGGDQK